MSNISNSQDESLLRPRSLVHDSSPSRPSPSMSGLTQDSSAQFNLDMALAKVGGFGRYQTLITLGISLLRNSGSVLVYILAYLVLA